MSRRNPAPLPVAGEEQWVVDGIEDTAGGRVARVELPGGHTADLPLHQLPDGLKEGDVLAVQDGPDGMHARLLTRQTATRAARAQSRLDALNTPTQEGEEITL